MTFRLRLNSLLFRIRDEEKIGILLIEHDMSVVMKVSVRIFRKTTAAWQMVLQ